MHINDLPVEILQHIFEFVFNRRTIHDHLFWKKREADFSLITKTCRCWDQIVREMIFESEGVYKVFYVQWRYDGAGVGAFRAARCQEKPEERKWQLESTA